MANQASDRAVIQSAQAKKRRLALLAAFHADN
jgi:hypothetical protein